MNVSKNISTQSIKANPETLFLLAGPVFGVGTFSPRLWVHRNVSVVPIAADPQESLNYAEQINSRLRTIEDQIFRIGSGQSEFKQVVFCSELLRLLNKGSNSNSGLDNFCYNSWLHKIRGHLGIDIGIATLRGGADSSESESNKNERASAKVVPLKTAPDWKKSA